MRIFLEQYRHLSLLVAVLLAQLFFLAFQIRTDNEVRLLRFWAAAAVTPIQKTLNWSVGTVGALKDDYLFLYNTRQENRELKAELDAAKIRIQELAARADEADRLARLLGLRERYALTPLVGAEVIGTAPSANLRTVMIGAGANKGLKPNMVVITPDGVAGKLDTVHPSSSVVLLFTDAKSGVGVRVADTRVYGVLKGNGSDICEMAYVPNEEDIQPGALLVTSGLDQIFPKGLPVGRVISAERGDPNQNVFFWTIEVEPVVPLARLEHVMILTAPPQSLTSAQQPGQTPDTVTSEE